MVTNRDVLVACSLEKLLFMIDQQMTENIDHMQEYGPYNFKYGCVLDVLTSEHVERCDEYMAVDTGCFSCIKDWLDSEYDGTWMV